MKVIYLGGRYHEGYNGRLAHIECENESDKALEIVTKTTYAGSVCYADEYCVDIKVDDKHDFNCFMSEWKQAKKELKHA